MSNAYLYKQVMVVDDTDIDRLISVAFIKKNLFAEEVSAHSSVFAALRHLHALEKHPDSFPPVIFLDVNMPIMDGFAFLDNYLKLPDDLQRRSTIIMISATNSEEDFVRIHSYPIVRMFFQKPLSEAILNEIRTAMAIAVS